MGVIKVNAVTCGAISISLELEAENRGGVRQDMTGKKQTQTTGNR